MKLGCGHPMGPFELMDIVGFDVTHAILNSLHEEFRERRYAPAPLLEHMVRAGYLGRKTGQRLLRLLPLTEASADRASRPDIPRENRRKYRQQRDLMNNCHVSI